MRIATWNIQWGLGMDGSVDLARIVDHIGHIADPDVFCVQEVSAHMPDLKSNAGGDQFAELAGLLSGYTAVEGAALENIDTDGTRRRFGNMIFSRYPVVQVMRHTLPWLPDGDRNMPRGLIEATVLAPFGALRIMTTHLEYFSGQGRAAQVDGIRRAHDEACARAATTRPAGSGPYATVAKSASALLMGDFNMKPDDATKLRISEPFESGAPALHDTWRTLNGDAPHPPSFCITDQTYGPPNCCDFIFASEDLAPQLKSIAYDTETRLSDHQPVILTLSEV